MKFTLTIGKSTKPSYSGYIDVDKNSATFFEKKRGFEDRCVAILCRPRLEWVGADVMHISGFELIGSAKNGTPKYKFQEWYLRQIEEKP